MASVVNPMSSALDSTRDRAQLRGLFLTAAKASVIFGLPVCIGFIVLGERFIRIWMGPAFGPMAGQVLLVLGVAHLVGLPYYTISNVLYGLAQPRVVARARVVEGVANLALSIILVQYLGVIGVAIGTLVPHVAIAAFFLPSLMPRLMSVGLWEYYVSTYGRPLVASVPFWAVCVAIERYVQPASLVTFLATVSAGLVTYALPCWFIALDADERLAIRKRFGRMSRR
jgi:O-antigen/teichoic acid export membrane protein